MQVQRGAGKVLLDRVGDRPSPKISFHQSIATFPGVTASNDVKLLLAGTEWTSHKKYVVEEGIFARSDSQRKHDRPSLRWSSSR